MSFEIDDRRTRSQSQILKQTIVQCRQGDGAAAEERRRDGRAIMHRKRASVSSVVTNGLRALPESKQAVPCSEQSE